MIARSDGNAELIIDHIPSEKPTVEMKCFAIAVGKTQAALT